MKKRFLAAMLSGILTLQFMSAGVYAAGNGDIVTTSPSDSVFYDEEMDPAGSSFDYEGMTYRVTDWTTCELQSVGIPEGDIVIPAEVKDPFGDVYRVTGIAADALAGCAGVESLTLPAGLTAIDLSGAMLTDLETITFDNDVEDCVFTIIDGVLYEKLEDGMRLVLYPSGLDKVNFVVPNGTTEIGTRAFYGCRHLQTVILPQTLKTLESEAFCAFANPAQIAFNMDEAPVAVASGAFSLTDADNNEFYFRSGYVLKALEETAADFAGETDAVMYTDGIPAGLMLIADNEASALNRDAGVNTELEEGWYYFVSELTDGSEQFALDIEKGAGSVTADANADIYSLKNGVMNAMLFYVASCGESQYSLTPYGNSRFCLDIDTAMTAPGTNVRQHRSNNTGAQKFYFVSTEETDVYEIQTTIGDTCLAVKGEAANGANVELAAWTNEASQRWKAVKTAAPTAEDADLKEGWYRIRSSMDENYALDITLGVTNKVADSNLDIYEVGEDDVNEAQLFYLTKVDKANGYYTLTPWTAYTMAVDADTARYAAGTNLRQHKANGTVAQSYQILKQADGTCMIKCLSASTCFTVESDTAENGANVALGNWQNLASQKWIFEYSDRNLANADLPAGIYEFHTALDTTDSSDTSGRVMAVSRSNMIARDNIELVTAQNRDTERFYLYPLGNSQYYVLNAATMMAIDVAGGNAVNKTNVQIYKRNNTTAQIWTIKVTKDGYYRIYTPLLLNGKKAMCLDVNHGISEERQNIQIYQENYDSKAQLWVIADSDMAPLTNGVYEIASALKSDRTATFDLPARSSAEGIQYQLFTKKDITSQKFNAVFSDNTVTFANVKSAKYLGASGSKVIQQTSAYTWTYESAGDGTYYIKSADGLYMAPEGGSTENMTMVGLTAEKSDAAKWYLTKSQVANGWQVVGDQTYYYRNGSALKSSYIGNAFVDANGVLWQGWHKAYVSGTRCKAGYYYYFNGKSGAAMDARPYLWNSTKIWGKSTRSVRTNKAYGDDSYVITTRQGVDATYGIFVDTVNCYIIVYAMWPGTNAFNVPVFAFKISPGLAPNVTNPGQTTIKAQSNWTELMGPSYGQYTSLLNYADGEYIHSVACGKSNTWNVDTGTYNLLGQRASHGCMRAAVRNAYWIYMFCKVGTYANISDIGHTLTIDLIPQPKMTGSTAIDPTDVAYTGNFDYVDSYSYYGGYTF